MEVTITRAAAVMKKWEPLTVGMSKAVPIRMTLSEDWANLAKVAVFRAGTTVVDVLDSSWPEPDMCYVPPEVLTVAGARVEFGLYGTNADDAVVIPTIWVNLGRVQTAPDPDGDPTTDPTLPVWAQIQAEMIDSMEINSAGHLIVTYHDGDAADLGSVIGPQGETGPEGPEGPEGPPGSLGIYIATYGVTTSAEIEAAYQAGKFLLCKQTSNGLDFYYAFTRRQSSTIHDFGLCFWGNTAPTIRAVYCQADSWHGYSRDIAVVNSPAFGGTPTAPTADAGTDTTQIATTAFVQDAIRGIENQLVPSGGDSGYVLKKASSDDFDLEWAAESGGGGADNIYVATYGTTTSAEIEAAYQAGKQIFVEQGGRIMRMTYRESATRHYFGCLYRDVIISCSVCICDNGSWSGARRDLVKLNDFAAIFDSTQSYTAGTYIIHNGDLYVFTANHTGNWSDAHATRVVLTDEITALAASIPAAATATPQALGTAAVGSSSKYAREDHVHAKPTYSKSDIGLGNVDNVQQYSATNPPPYPVTSVNGATGAVTLEIHNVPSSGNAGQVLKKNSATDYDVAWGDMTQTYPSAYCTTAAATAAKKASCSLWTATANSYLHVLMGAANTNAGAITLNVNSTGAKPIYINGEASSASNYTLPAGSYLVFYDGTNFHFRTDGKLPADITGHASGDIPAPASPTSGQILGYNGSAWVAETPVPEVTVSTSGDVTQALDAGKAYHFTGAISSLTLTMNAAPTGRLAQYHFDFDSGSTPATVTLAGVSWPSGSFSPEASKHYEVDILNGYGVVMAW